MTHPTWQLDVEQGALILTPCPGTKDASLQNSLEQLKAQGVQAVVTALDDHELAEKKRRSTWIINSRVRYAMVSN